MQAAVYASARRGAWTSIVFPARNDGPFRGGLLHTKTLTVDGAGTPVGSANMDRRRFGPNFENNVLVHDRALTSDIRARQDEYVASSSPVTRAAVDARSWHRRLRHDFAAILGPVL